MTGALILIAEDNDKNRKLVRDVLTFKGHEVIESETGEEGVRLAQERRPSLVLMDIRLPGIDGIKALRRLRAEETTRGIPVMAMTASVMTEDRQKIMAAGFDAYQNKPINVTDFVAAVAQLLERRQPLANRSEGELARPLGGPAARVGGVYVNRIRAGTHL